MAGHSVSQSVRVFLPFFFLVHSVPRSILRPSGNSLELPATELLAWVGFLFLHSVSPLGIRVAFLEFRDLGCWMSRIRTGGSGWVLGIESGLDSMSLAVSFSSCSIMSHDTSVRLSIYRPHPFFTPTQ